MENERIVLVHGTLAVFNTSVCCMFQYFTSVTHQIENFLITSVTHHVTQSFYLFYHCLETLYFYRPYILKYKIVAQQICI